MALHLLSNLHSTSNFYLQRRFNFLSNCCVTIAQRWLSEVTNFGVNHLTKCFTKNLQNSEEISHAFLIDSVNSCSIVCAAKKYSDKLYIREIRAHFSPKVQLVRSICTSFLRFFFSAGTSPKTHERLHVRFSPCSGETTVFQKVASTIPAKYRMGRGREWLQAFPEKEVSLVKQFVIVPTFN